MISNVIKNTRIARPRFFQFGQIQREDLIVYYASKDMVVVGTFRVVSDIRCLQHDRNWGDVMVFDIEPFKLPPSGKYLDFKKLVTTPNIFFEMFPNKTMWGTYLQGKTCLMLTAKDYRTIEEAASQEKYLKDKEEMKITFTRWHEKHGKGLEQLLLSLSDSEKRILMAIVNIEKNCRSVHEEDLVLRLADQEKDLLDDLLKELKIKRLLRRLSGKSGQYRFFTTKRGRIICTIIWQAELRKPRFQNL
jgi:hypothetical protein